MDKHKLSRVNSCKESLASLKKISTRRSGFKRVASIAMLEQIQADSKLCLPRQSLL